MSRRTLDERDARGNIRNIVRQETLFPGPGLTPHAQEAIRVHEAAHAVVLLATGGDVLSCVADPRGGGGVRGRRWTEHACLADIAAERIGEYSLRWHPGAMSKTELRLVGWGDDVRSYRRANGGTVRKLRSDLEETEALVRAHWPDVLRVAAALRDRERLTGDEVRGIVEGVTT